MFNYSSINTLTHKHESHLKHIFICGSASKINFRSQGRRAWLLNERFPQFNVCAPKGTMYGPFFVKIGCFNCVCAFTSFIKFLF